MARFQVTGTAKLMVEVTMQAVVIADDREQVEEIALTQVHKGDYARRIITATWDDSTAVEMEYDPDAEEEERRRKEYQSMVASNAPRLPGFIEGVAS